MDFGIYAGDTDKTIYVRLRDSTTGLAKTGLAYNSSGVVFSYTLPLAARAAITPATQTVTGAHSDGGFVEIDATNAKGLYRLDLPDAAIASGAFTVVSVQFTGVISESVLIPLHNRKVQLADSVTHGGSSAILQLNRLIAISTASGEPGIKAVGNGLGAGMYVEGYDGLYCVGNSSDGIHATGADKDIEAGEINGIIADLPQRITKNTALAKFPFKMVDSTDHITAKTGLTVTATRSLDGAAFGACANSAAEIGSGWYYIDLDAADLNGNTVVLKFTATGADTREITIITQPT